MKVFYCSIIQNRLAEARANYPIVKEYLKPNAMVIVDGGSTDGTIEFLDSLGIIVIHRTFDGDFIQQRNVYMTALKDMVEDGDILAVSDSDEFFSVDLLRDMREIAGRAFEDDYNFIRVRANDKWVDRNGEMLSKGFSDFWKPLIAIWEPGGEYIGAKGKPIHEELYFPSGRRAMVLEDECRYFYTHRKQYGITWPRALRNFYISGVGPDGQAIPYWQSFVDLLASYGMMNWPEVERRFAQGNLPNEIKTWLIEYRGAPYEEVRDCFLAYFVWWCAEEMPPDLLPQYASEIEKIHGG